MSLASSHPLLRLVDANKNSLKCALVMYIDVTVEQQFGQLRNRIVSMIESGEIVLGDVNVSNQQKTNQITCPPAPLANHVTTSPVIKQECDDRSSSTIPINVPCNDAPNDGDKEKSNNVGISSLNEGQNEKAPIDDVKEEYDNDDDDEGEYFSDCAECEDCVNGICSFDGEHDDAHNDAHTGVDMLIGLGKDEQPNVLSESDLKLTDNSNKSAHYENDLSLINEAERQNCNIRDPTRQMNENPQSSQPIKERTQQSIPSTELRSPKRKQAQKKMVGVDQSNGEGKSDKRKSTTQSKIAVKKVKHQEVEQTDQGEDDEAKEETKLQVVTLEVNCTEPGCKKILKCLELWTHHLTTFHGQKPYKQLENNVRHNQHDQTEYFCTDCEVVTKSQLSLITHWKNFHQTGKFKCSDCEFVDNLRSEVLKHQMAIHRSKKFQCTHQGCDKAFKSNYELEKHQRVHNGEKPFACTWQNCHSTFKQIKTATDHVRTKHFRLPRTVKEQNELNIIDQRNPRDYVRIGN